MLLASSWQYNMVISGFVLGTIIFALFLWTAIENYLSIKQIYRFKAKTNNVYTDKLSKTMIRTFEVVITVLWVALVAFFVASLLTHQKYINNESSKYWNNTASAIAITHDAVFLIEVVLVIVYMAIAHFYNASIIIAIDENNLITSTDLIAQNMITVSRLLGHRFFKITYRDADLKGNLKEVKLRYTKELEAFLTNNGFYKGEQHD